jgi:hypothetical protein
MKRRLKFMGFAAVGLTLGIAATVGANPTATFGSSSIPRDQVVTGRSGLGGTGNFVGTIVEVSCDLDSPPGTRADCDRTGHYYALRTDGQLALQPILAGTKPIIDELRSGRWTDKEVRVTGVSYSSTGAILASEIEPHSASRSTGFGILIDGDDTSTRH